MVSTAVEIVGAALGNGMVGALTVRVWGEPGKMLVATFGVTANPAAPVREIPVRTATLVPALVRVMVWGEGAD
jgi:diaminopimelate decarboxylase